MKKRNGIILASILAFMFIGCGSSNDDTGCCNDSSVVEESTMVTIEKSNLSKNESLFSTSSYSEDVEGKVENKIEEKVEEPILGTLSVEQTYDSFLVVPQEELYGNVIVPDLTSNSVEDEEEANETLPLSDELSVVEDSLNLDIPKCAISDIDLPEHGENNTTITWESDHEDTLDNQGHVTRPKKCKKDVHVILTATISKGDVQVQKEFNVGVIKEMGSDKEAAKRDAQIIRYFVPRKIYEDKIELAEEGLNGSFITWESNDEAIIALDGTVTAQEEDVKVILTLTSVNNGETYVTDIKVVVKAEGSQP